MAAYRSRKRHIQQVPRKRNARRREDPSAVAVLPGPRDLQRSLSAVENRKRTIRTSLARRPTTGNSLAHVRRDGERRLTTAYGASSDDGEKPSAMTGDGRDGRVSPPPPTSHQPTETYSPPRPCDNNALSTTATADFYVRSKSADRPPPAHKQSFTARLHCYYSITPSHRINSRARDSVRSYRATFFLRTSGYTVTTYLARPWNLQRLSSPFGLVFVIVYFFFFI